MLTLLAYTLSLTLFSHAQSTVNNTNLGIEAIEAHFNNSGIVPGLLKDFSPTAVLSLNYNGAGEIQPGQKLTVDQVKPTPNLTVTPADPSTIFSGQFTVVMVDADVVGADESKGQTRHWLVNNATISGNSVHLENAVGITKYAGPFPAQGSGAHRYVVLIYSQPPSFVPPGDLAKPNQPVASFNFNQYVSSSHLGPIVAATYYTVEQGTASSSVSATSPVITSTLAAATPASSGSAAKPSSSPGGSKNSGKSIIHNTPTYLSSLLVVIGIVLVS